MNLQDAIIHNAPDVRSWPEVLQITTVTLSPGKSGGFAFEFDKPVPPSWDYHKPGWGDGGADTGNILYTVWAVIQMGGAVHASGFLQMWRGKPSTGAPPLSQWFDWAYARNRWGDMVDYRPAPGDRFGLLVTAGNARGEKGPTSVAERSTYVEITLPPSDQGAWRFGPVPPLFVPDPLDDPGSGETTLLLQRLDTLLADMRLTRIAVEKLASKLASR